jgi:NAD(P)-dependent dehydrogenase (short-subunit alcohol dehydrogenase family)
MELKNKVVVITGGNQGFGKSLAKFFVAEGCLVIISDKDKEGLNVVSKELSVDQFPPMLQKLMM